MKNINKKGYTLIELIIVLVIIAIGATLMIPGMRKWNQSYQLRSATRDVISTLRAAQMNAISTNTMYGVSFDTNNYRLYQSTGGLYNTKGPLITLPTGVTFNNNNFTMNATLGKPFAQFNPDSTSNGGSVKVVGANGSKIITVTTSTGRINVQ